jgi:Flp pilus assembly protein TadD
MTTSDFRQQPLRGAALYNPHLHGKNELLSLFVVRQALLDQLLEDLRATDAGKSPQHHLILGQRGMGKTMLLRRLGYAIEDDVILRDRWLPLNFPEEQYNIAHLSDFWLNCIDSLSDLLEMQGRHDVAEDLDDRAAALRSSGEEQRSRQALGLLVGAARELGRRLVLLVDNVDLIFERVREQEWALREVLSSEPALVMIGASANAVESSFAYDQAFYDFFRVHELEGLSFEETCEFLLRYAEIWGTPEVKRVAEQEMGRIKVLHTLTGGNPRTLVLLFNVLAVGVEGDVRTDLERLLDQSTPLYKARFEAHSTQAQQIVHAMAVRWDPISAGELAEDLGWEVNVVSAQLSRLVKQGTVEKVAYDPESKTGFQIAERFFNIWYLMRASRRLRRRLIWLVEFLKVLYSQEELRAKAMLHLHSVLKLEPTERLRYAEYSFALADAMTDNSWRSSLEKSGLHAILKDDVLRGRLAEFIDLEVSDPTLKETAAQWERFEQARSRVAGIALTDVVGGDFWAKLKDSLLLTQEVKIFVAENIGSLRPGLIKDLYGELNLEPKLLKDKYACPRIIDSLAKAVQGGLMTDTSDLEGAVRAESILGIEGLEAVALANQLDRKSSADSLPTLARTIQATTSPFPWIVWIKKSLEVAYPIDLEWAVKEVSARACSNGLVASSLGIIFDEFGRTTEAENAHRSAIELEPGNPFCWAHLGLFLSRHDCCEEALQAANKAIDLDSKYTFSWLALGSILVDLGRYGEGEQAHRAALKEDPENASLWVSLGLILCLLKRFGEAEEAYRKALEVESDLHVARSALAWLLLQRSDFKAAENLARGLPEDDEEAAGILAVTLAHKGDWESAAVLAKRFVSARANQDPVGWMGIVEFFREAARAGKSRQALDLLEETGTSERWRPLCEALEAIARGGESYLRRVAPEVRPAARQLFKELQGPVSVGLADPTKRSSSRRRTGRKKP